MFIVPNCVTIWTKPLSSIEIILPSNMLGCSGFVLSTLSIFTATISDSLNLGCFFSCRRFVCFTMSVLYFVWFSVIFCLFLGGSSLLCCVVFSLASFTLFSSSSDSLSSLSSVTSLFAVFSLEVRGKKKLTRFFKILYSPKKFPCPIF